MSKANNLSTSSPPALKSLLRKDRFSEGNNEFSIPHIDNINDLIDSARTSGRNDAQVEWDFEVNPLQECVETTQVGNYILGGLLGSGSVGKVYKGLHKTTGKFVAIKEISRHYVQEQIHSRQIREVEIMQNLNHPNILKFIDIIDTKNNIYLIFEYVENGSLKDIVGKFGNFPESLAKVYIIQLLNGIKYLHDQNIVHRDIKGANVLITKEGTCKLADFGLAAHLIDNSTKAAGTPYWMAPELFESEIATSKSDIWSLGCTIIELLTGNPPFSDLAPLAAIFHIVDSKIAIPPICSPDLHSFLECCLKKDFNLRANASDLLQHQWIINDNNSMPIVPVGIGELTMALKTHRKMSISAPDTNQQSSKLCSSSYQQTLKQLSKIFSDLPKSSRQVDTYSELQSYYDQAISSTNALFNLAYSLESDLNKYMQEAEEVSMNWQKSMNSLTMSNKTKERLIQQIERLENQIVQTDEKYAKIIYGENISFNAFTTRVKKGVLKVRKVDTKLFKKRYVVLRDNFLFFYRTFSEEEEPCDVVWLNSVSIDPLAKSPTIPPNTFTVITRKKNYQLCSANENIMLSWMRSISFCRRWYEVELSENDDYIPNNNLDNIVEKCIKYKHAEGFLSLSSSSLPRVKANSYNGIEIPTVNSSTKSKSEVRGKFRKNIVN